MHVEPGERVAVSLTVNGVDHEVEVEPRARRVQRQLSLSHE